MAGPPTSPSSTFNQERFDKGLKDVGDACKGIYSQVTTSLARTGIPVWLIPYAAIVPSIAGFLLYIIIGLLTTILLPLLLPLVIEFMGALLQIRKETPEIQLQLSAAALSEFLGVEIAPETLAPAKGAANSLQVAETIGNALYGRLTSEFTTHGQVTPESGEAAAKSFSGFAINFATQNTLISTLADATSFHLLEDFRELGVEAAQNLGLGRLQRLALGTLLKNTIQVPYNHCLQERYRPNKLGDSQYVHSYHRGEIDLATLRKELGYAGYKEPDIDKLIAEYDTKLTTAECMLLVRYGELTVDAAEKQLVAQGMTPAVAHLKIRAAQLTLINDNVTSYAAALGELKKNGRMDPDTYAAQMHLVPWTDDEKAWTARATGIALDFPDMKLTFAQVTTAFEQGIVDVDYVDRWLRFQQYSDEDVLNMELILAVKFDAFVAKAEATAAALAKKNAAKPPPATTP